MAALICQILRNQAYLQLIKSPLRGRKGHRVLARGILRHIAGYCHVTFLASSLWPEFGPMNICSCKGGWNI